MIVADATVFTALAKIGKLGVLRRLYTEAVMTPTVRTEVVEGGKRVNAVEVKDIEAAVKDGWISATRLSRMERQTAERIARSAALGRDRKSVV